MPGSDRPSIRLAQRRLREDPGYRVEVITINELLESASALGPLTRASKWVSTRDGQKYVFGRKSGSADPAPARWWSANGTRALQAAAAASRLVHWFDTERRSTDDKPTR